MAEDKKEAIIFEDDNPLTKVIELKHAIPVPKKGGGTVNVKEIILRRFKVKDLKNLPKNFMKRKGEGLEPREVIALIAGLADLPESAIDEMDLEDLAPIAEGLGDFLSQSLGTGKS